MDKEIFSNQDLISAVWSGSPIVIALMNENGRFIYVNSVAQKFWEYTEDELLKKRWQDLTHPEDLMSDLEMHKQLKNGDFEVPYYSMCKRYITKSGRMVWGSVTVHILKNERGEFFYFLSQVVPLDMMHHMNNNLFEKLSENGTRRNIEQNEIEKPESQFSLSKISNINRGFLIGLVAVLTSVIVFLADFKYNQQRINDVERKIENINTKLDTSIDKLTKLMEENLKRQSTKN